MNQWWSSLAARERRILLGGAAVVLLLMGWRGVWVPLNNNVRELTGRVAARRTDLAWMQEAAAEVRRLRTGGQKSGQTDTSLIDVVGKTAQQRGISGALTRMTPRAGGALAVDLDSVDFDGLMHWLAALQQAGLSVRTLSVSRTNSPGLVEAHCVVGR